jgi:ketosteroid isomerase-like protein
MDENFHPAMFASHESVEQAFYDALERGDLEALMGCWSEEDDIVCIHPNGPRLVGTAAIRRGFATVLEHGPLPIRPRSIHIQNAMMSSIHSVVEEITVHERSGATVRAHAFATNIYAKTPMGWRMVLHHASQVSMDIPAESFDEAPRPSVLH